MDSWLHLLAMPLAYPLHPSSQIGHLHGYMESRFRGRIRIHSYSAFLEILASLSGESMVDFFERYSLLGEELLFLSCVHHAQYRLHLPLPSTTDFDDMLQLYNQFGDSELNTSLQKIEPISREMVVALNGAMEDYLDERIVPALHPQKLNVIGFTATFCQVFGSIFAARYLQRKTNANILFVFGGSSFSVPEGTRALEKWGIDGFIVTGSGEFPLEQIMTACLEYHGKFEGLADFISNKNFANVFRIGVRKCSIQLTGSKKVIEDLPDPNYDEFFERLCAHCADPETHAFALSHAVTVPVEGSRGCFARCDFCHNPNITARFGSLTGKRVAERVERLCTRYGLNDVTFVDSVCNTWAEEYAECLLAKNRQVASFMEMRVHAPETMWTKLALSGVRTVQLGVEAISEVLLKAMRKGTHVIQNLAATKFMAELGVRNASNLIICHPKSTIADVEKTKRILQMVPHFPVFQLSYYVVSYDSPIYRELGETRQSELIRGFEWLPAELRDYSWPRHLSYSYEAEWIDPAVRTAWREFQAWHNRYNQENAAHSPVFTVERNEKELHFTDSRFGRKVTFSLSDAEAAVYDSCHAICTVAQIAKDTGLSLLLIEEILASFVKRCMVVCIGTEYLALAFRPRTELIQRFCERADSECDAMFEDLSFTGTTQPP